MHILIESGTYAVDNVGDIAMLQRTVLRLRELWPDAALSVVTEQPERLGRVIPAVEPVPASPWFRVPVFPVPRRWQYTPMTMRIRWRERLLAGRMPRVARAGKCFNPWTDPDERCAADAFYRAVKTADAVVAAGGGYINDHYYEHAWKVLATLSLAQGFHKPTAMFGIGLGPLSRPELTQHGGAVLRRLRLLALREDTLGPAEAKRLGIEDANILVTGDDAVAIAAAHPVPHVDERRGIGFNLRLSVDAVIPESTIHALREALTTVARVHDAALIPAIVRTAASPDNDVDAARRLVGADAQGIDASEKVASPQQALRRIAACRVVVTGAYHNAVFALSMGIPVVAVYQAPYYESKFRGVAREFGTGMTLLRADHPELRDALIEAVQSHWDEAAEIAEPLRRAAANQIALSDEAYRRFYEHVQRGRVRKSA